MSPSTIMRSLARVLWLRKTSLPARPGVGFPREKSSTARKECENQLKISVIIPSYNRAGLIGETIENMLSQSYRPHELIVVDDGSTDNSVEVIKQFGDAVRLIEQTNQGPGAARNRGFEESTGDLIQFMDSDDLASLNKLEVQAAALMTSGADFAYCPWVRTEINERTMKFVGPVLQSEPVPDWKPMLEWALGAWCLVFQNCLFRRDCLVQAGSYRTDLMPTEDSEYFVRILLKGAKPVFTDECLVFYRFHDEGQITSSGTTEQARAKDMSQYYEVIGENIDGHFESMHSSTKRELARLVANHNRYCKTIGLEGSRPGSIIHSIVESRSAFLIKAESLIDRITRKLRRTTPATPNQPAMKPGSLYSNFRQLSRLPGYQTTDLIN